MKLKEAARVYSAVVEMMEQETGFAFAHALCMAKKELEPHVQFYGGKEMELIRKYAEPMEDGNLTDQEGKFRIQAEKAEDYFREKKELDEVEVDVRKVSSPTMPDRIAGKTLEALMEILDFPGEGDA